MTRGVNSPINTRMCSIFLSRLYLIFPIHKPCDTSSLFLLMKIALKENEPPILPPWQSRHSLSRSPAPGNAPPCHLERHES